MTTSPESWCNNILGDAGNNSPAIQKLIENDYFDSGYFRQLFLIIKRFSNWSEIPIDDLIKLTPTQAQNLLFEYAKVISKINRNSYIEYILNGLVSFFYQNNIDINLGEYWEFLPDDSRVLGVAFSDEEITQLWELNQTSKIKNPNVFRNCALLVILICTGCRLKDIVEIKKKDLFSINGFYRIEFKTHINERSSEIRFIGFLNPTAKRVLDDYLNSIETLDSNDFIFNLSIIALEQFYKKLCDRAKIKLNVFGTNQNMKTNQRIRKRLFDILEKNNISKDTVKYLQPPRENEYDRNIISQDKINKMFEEYKKVAEHVFAKKFDILSIVEK